jgi:hypothetical protein
VVFFEIFPKGKSVGGTGFQHVFAMVVGFAAFLPSLFFREFDRHEILANRRATKGLIDKTMGIYNSFHRGP